MSQVFKIFFNWTANAGTAYYRMINFAKYIRREKRISLAYSDFNQKRGTIADWEINLQDAMERQDQTIINRITTDMDMLMNVADISVWQMLHTAASYSLFKTYREKYRSKKIICMECDDNFFAVNPESQAFINYHPNSDLETYAGWQLRNANFVIVSTDYLKELFMSYNKSIEVIPNSIDFGIWDSLQKPKKDHIIRIGWAGGAAHNRDLKIIEKVIPVITNKYDNVEFVFMGFIPDFIRNHSKVRFLNDWHGILDYPQQLSNANFDIGIAPLRDNLFNRAKSNLRYLEYSALKIPTIASPVEPFNKTIIEGKNSMFALETDEWINKLSELIEDKKKRQFLGLQAYKLVKSKYNVADISMQYLKLLRRLVNGKEKINKSMFDEESNGTITVDI